jgi:DNA topoisomerase II
MYTQLLLNANMATMKSVTSDDDLSTKYQQKTDKQHILDNPDTYVGSIENVDSVIWLYDPESSKIKEKNIEYIPALYKLFDEGIVNCRDHVIRMTQAVDNEEPDSIPVTNIDISITDDGTISMYNDGNGIDIAKHPEYDVWIPELIFGHLRTSTNYNKKEEKIVGGKNGFGFKLVLIWSTFGSVETIDHKRGLKYTQSFHDNLNVIDKPKITKCKSKPFTRITFRPDYTRLGITTLTPDMVNLFKRRIYDIAAVTCKNVKVKCNSQLIPVKTFQQYTDLYLNTDAKKVYDSPNARWEYAVAVSPTHEFIQVSFVNGIYTSKGGKHVDYIMGQITRKLIAYIEKKKKVSVNTAAIKEQLMLFIRCDIVNPAFDSQTKDYMNTPSSKFGSTCTVDDKAIDKIAKLGIMDVACAISEIKDTKAAKKTDGVKTKNIRGIPKLIDANWAGTAKSSDCVIILCEGDSAKAGIVSGLSSDDRNTIGVYPMKGKIMNVRGENKKKISENTEIADIKKILGLETGKTYKTADEVRSSLRYGKVLFMTDQDLDGSHIKGLCLNLFQSEWYSLSQIPEFIGFMNTPILKAKKGSQTLVFYNEGEYEAWKNETDTKGWTVKYYKGLGTSTGKEFREYFEKKKTVWFSHTGETSDDTIDMVFNKKRSDDRKGWLGMYSRESFVDTSLPIIPYEDFINKELIHFSKYDCERSIPNLMDGLKISQRKILYSAFKKNLNNEIKVAQFTGYVSEHSGYHHGEASLNGAIVGMAQNFIGSNNINLFSPNGQFGTRLRGGKDSASERYIYTLLSPITRKLFPNSDDNILKYLNDDGLMVEPIYYAPIIPMILVNGTKGIGTGFSTDVMCYNPSEIIDYIKTRLETGVFPIDTEFIPYYEGYKGTITKIANSKYLIKGKYDIISEDKIRITELPIGLWTDDFKEYLEKMTDTTDKNGKKITPLVKDYDDMSKDTTIDITVTLTKDKLSALCAKNLEHSCTELEKSFKLFSQNSTTNMHLFGADDKLKKYDSPNEIIHDYFGTRYQMYDTRKEYLIKQIESELLILKNKHTYIQDILNGDIDLRRKKKKEITELLLSRKYDIIDNDEDFKYLTKMAMDCVTEENVEKLIEQYTDKQKQLDVLKNTTIEQMWISELNTLKIEYEKHREQLQISIGGNNTKVKSVKKIKLVKKSVK